MSNPSAAEIQTIVKQHGRTRPALMNIMREIQATYRWIAPGVITLVAKEMSLPRGEVQGFVSFYAFLSEKPQGQVTIRLCVDIIDQMHGISRVINAFRDELGIDIGEVTADGLIGLETTACMGLSDQAPAALFNEVPITELYADRIPEIVRELRAIPDPRRLVKTLGDGNNAHELVRSMVKNNLREMGNLIFSPINRGESIRKATVMSPREVIRSIKASRLRGRGGAGFPTGMKLEFTRDALGARKFIICNADEGEPGTLKDRVILTERADRVFAGMTISAYAIGAAEGLMYLRGEYEYLLPFLESVLEQRRKDGMLGKDIVGKPGFDFDIRIQMGAGAYICGEETALISSCEGKRGEPKNRPPFPAQEGYLGCPTSVNNVETLCCIAKILEHGAASFAEYGTPQSTGTKVLSICGDVLRPGVYEVPFGVTIRELLLKAGAEDVQAVQVGGPSGKMIGAQLFDRHVCFDDLATGGSIMVFNTERDLLEVVESFLEFFTDESCGYCTPCRVGSQQLMFLIQRIRAGQGEPADLEQLRRVAGTMKLSSRCGLGQTACHPVTSTLENFPEIYEVLVEDDPRKFRRSFDLATAVADAEEVIGRPSIHLMD